MVKIWLDFNFAEAYLNTSLFINIKIIIIIYLLFNYLRTGPFLFAIATRLIFFVYLVKFEPILILLDKTLLWN